MTSRKKALAEGVTKYNGRPCKKHPELKGLRYVGDSGCPECKLDYERKQYRYVRADGRHKNKNTEAGYVCELLAVADLVDRCGMAYLNPMPQTKADAFVRTSLGWYSVQVKSAHVRRTKTPGQFLLNLCTDRQKLKADLVCLVDRKSKRVRYLPWDKKLPDELPTGPHGVELLGGSA